MESGAVRRALRMREASSLTAAYHLMQEAREEALRAQVGGGLPCLAARPSSALPAREDIACSSQESPGSLGGRTQASLAPSLAASLTAAAAPRSRPPAPQAKLQPPPGEQGEQWAWDFSSLTSSPKSVAQSASPRTARTAGSSSPSRFGREKEEGERAGGAGAGAARGPAADFLIRAHGGSGSPGRAGAATAPGSPLAGVFEKAPFQLHEAWQQQQQQEAAAVYAAAAAAGRQF